MKNNKGFSLIELLVVVLILSVSVTIISASISTIFTLNPRKTANQLDSLISKCKISALARAGNVSLEISKTAEGVIATYYEGSAAGEEQIIGKSSVLVSYTDSASNTTELTATDKLYISFDRTTGGFTELHTAFIRTGGSPGDADEPAEDVYCEKISVSGGKTYTITLVPSTGKHFITAG